MGWSLCKTHEQCVSYEHSQTSTCMHQHNVTRGRKRRGITGDDSAMWSGKLQVSHVAYRNSSVVLGVGNKRMLFSRPLPDNSKEKKNLGWNPVTIFSNEQELNQNNLENTNSSTGYQVLWEPRKGSEMLLCQETNRTNLLFCGGSRQDVLYEGRLTLCQAVTWLTRIHRNLPRMGRHAPEGACWLSSPILQIIKGKKG